MPLSRSKLYIILLLGCAIGYVWIYFAIRPSLHEGQTIGVCFFKNITSIPCPSCGSTRSVVALLSGDFITAMKYNPLGIIILSLMLFVPIWIAFDLLSKRKSLLNAYIRIERLLRKPIYSIPLILIILIIWIWNIVKCV